MHEPHDGAFGECSQEVKQETKTLEFANRTSAVVTQRPYVRGAVVIGIGLLLLLALTTPTLLTPARADPLGPPCPPPSSAPWSSSCSGGGTFSNVITSFNVVTSYDGYTFYSRTATGTITGTTAGNEFVNALGVVLPSGAIVEEGTITLFATVDGLTGTITSQFNLYAANGVDFVGQLLGYGSNGLTGFSENAVFQGIISPTGPATGTYQTIYTLGGSAPPPVEAPLSSDIGSLTATDTQVGAAGTTSNGYTAITYTADTVDSGTSTGACTGTSNQLLVVDPAGDTFYYAGSCQFAGTTGRSAPGTDTAAYIGEGSPSSGAYVAAYGVSGGSGGLAGIQGTDFFVGTHGVAATISGWHLLPGSVGPNANLQNADLQGLVLQGYSLAGDNLQHASFANDNLGSLSFAHANMQMADLSGTMLTGTATQPTNFDGANMQNANLENAVCGSPNYITAAGANTQGIDLTGSSGCSPPL